MNLVQNSYLAWLEQEEANAQAQVKAYRAYYDGDPPTHLTSRQASFLNVDRDKNFGANVSAIVVDTLSERLEVTGFEVKSPQQEEGDEQAIEEIARLLDSWWQQNRMDARQDFVYQAALRDREAFCIVGYDNDKKRPTFMHDFAYDGTNGVKAHAKPGTYDELAFASKRWAIDHGALKGSRRLNLYFPDRIEKWITRTPADAKNAEAFWKPFEDLSDLTLQPVTLTDEAGNDYLASVSWWTDTGKQEGAPLGVPVIPFRNRDDGTGRGLSEIDNVMPLQDGVNKVFIDLLGASDMTGFQMYYTNAAAPSGGWKFYPGAVLEMVTEMGIPLVAGAFPPGDLSGLIAAWQAMIGLLAGISGTPQSRFNPAAQRPSGETQRQEESALIAKVKRLHKIWGNSWEDVMRLALRIEAAFGEQAVESDNLLISATWKEAEVRNEAEHVQAVATKVQQLELPIEQAWREVNYTADQIRDFNKLRYRTMSQTRLEMARTIAQQVNRQNGGNGNAPTGPQAEPSGEQLDSAGGPAQPG